jgi:arylsulfatase A-like enzyme
MGQLPRNIIYLIADSLRHDSVYGEGGTGLNYMEEKGIQFTEARSAGCWTLPATAGLFTGMLPHEHGATEQHCYD